jgi:hypothetical protein
VAALAAAVGAGAAMLVASPAALASTAGLAASGPTAAQTVSITAHPTTSGPISPFSNPLDITCTFGVDQPSVRSGVVISSAAARCTYDRDGSTANVPSLVLHEVLDDNAVLEDSAVDPEPNYYLAHTFVASSGCQHGLWNNYALLDVTFPAGYNPPSEEAAISASSTVAYCPGDPPLCLVTCPSAVGGAEHSMGAREPEPQPDVRPGRS